MCFAQPVAALPKEWMRLLHMGTLMIFYADFLEVDDVREAL